eukprot:CAMPEP_0117065488 /NCGR_PEP_ID=MMETSP0472-20121206/45789_1 /TAXON_ID=693140 ORGANISM="Tiarina fusus, Strain LIS" /NCGR_SAMPLE_ID=MMETSP0472 /ASSEMBLY_ACC=CAM_ASM_000603 /LENGTH=104 /DNA_ID=CAMNT_0004786149 /DNA_START=30 /DNA_END=341 /DNA_ORIENTATION=+
MRPSTPDVERDLAGVRGRVPRVEVQLLALRSRADHLVDADCHRRPLIALHEVDAVLCRLPIPSRRARADDGEHVLGRVLVLGQRRDGSRAGTEVVDHVLGSVDG